jgi:hypothetical protein
MACASSCMTRDHDTFGACLRAKNIHLGDVKGDGSGARRDLRFETYAAARRQGIQPASTKLKDSQAAIRASERAGVAFDANSV